MIKYGSEKPITVTIPSVFTYTDNDFEDNGKPIERAIDLNVVDDPAALVTRALLYGWGRSLNDAKGSSESLTEDERRMNQVKRFGAIMSNQWTQGGGGGAKADPILVEVRAIIVTKTRKTLVKVTKRFKTLVDVRKAYGDVVTDMWIAAAQETIENRATLGDADDDLPDVFKD